jgi:hypothetical protein
VDSWNEILFLTKSHRKVTPTFKTVGVLHFSADSLGDASDFEWFFTDKIVIYHKLKCSFGSAAGYNNVIGENFTSSC